MAPRIEYIVYGGESFDEFCASTDNEADARHYMFVYGQDGPVKLVKATTYEEVIDQTT